ncbi:hypothetical protein ACFLZ1_03340 [Patescibacteria group bacterium]
MINRLEKLTRAWCWHPPEIDLVLKDELFRFGNDMPDFNPFYGLENPDYEYDLGSLNYESKPHSIYLRQQSCGIYSLHLGSVSKIQLCFHHSSAVIKCLEVNRDKNLKPGDFIICQRDLLTCNEPGKGFGLLTSRITDVFLAQIAQRRKVGIWAFADDNSRILSGNLLYPNWTARVLEPLGYQKCQRGMERLVNPFKGPRLYKWYEPCV